MRWNPFGRTCNTKRLMNSFGMSVAVSLRTIGSAAKPREQAVFDFSAIYRLIDKLEHKI